MAAKDELGRRGERVAARYLERHGYRVLDRNWRCREGEVDLVVARAGMTAIVEVKSRSSLAFGHPFEAITVTKQARLRRLAAAWCRENLPAADEVRVDAIAVLGPLGQEPTVEHLRGVC